MKKPIQTSTEFERILREARKEQILKIEPKRYSAAAFHMAAKDVLADTDEEQDTVKKSAIPKELFEGWDRLTKGDKIKDIKDRDYTLYAVLYFDRFGSWPNDAREKMDFRVREIYEDALTEYKIKTMNKMSWDDLNKGGLLPLFTKLDNDGYREKFRTKFGKYPAY